MNTKFRLATVAVVLVSMGLAGCQNYEDPLPPRDGLYFPIGVEAHPDGRYVYVVNSNFDLLYRGDQGGTVSVIDTEAFDSNETPIASEATPYIPSFGAHMALNDDATKAYVTSRHNNELTSLTVADDGQGLYCETDGEMSSDSRACSTRRIPDSRDGSRIPTDPFGVAVGTTSRSDGDDLQSFDTVHLSHLAGSEVTGISFPEGSIAGATMQSARLVEQGGSQIEIRPGTEEVYVAGRSTRRVDSFSPFINESGQVEAIVRGNTVRLTERDRNIDARGLAFDDEGDWMYVATRRPSALHVIGMGDGAASPEVVTSIPLEQRPSELQFHRGADDVRRVYVPSYRHGVVEVVEPHREAVVDSIDVGRSPYSMAVDSPQAHCQEPGERCLGYVTLFNAGPDGQQRCDDGARYCGQLAVLDLDPDSETFHTVIDTVE